MKITKTLRIFLVLLSVMMVLPLFACGETPEETTTKAPEQTTAPGEKETTADKTEATTEPKAPATTVAPDDDDTTAAPAVDDTTEAETTSAETTDATTESGSETTETGSESSETAETTEGETTEGETTEAPCEHVEEAIPAVDATCDETGLTAGKKCSVCGEILVAQQVVPALGHTEETIPGKAATCTEAGLTEGKKCTVCGEILAEQTEIPAGHTEETVAGKAATCTETGLTDGKKCSVCGEVLVEQEEIAALGHNKVEKTYMAPTTAEAGWEAHKYCEACGTAWSTEDEELDAVPAIAKIVPATNKYWGYEEMKGVDIGKGDKAVTQPSDDHGYVRFSRAGEFEDGFYLFMEGNTDVTGKYVVFKYRTDHNTTGEFWANTTENGHSNGAANFSASYIADEQWHIIVYDLSAKIGNYVKANDDGEYVIQWARIDMLNAKVSEGYFDIAYIALCDDLSEVASIMQKGDEALCPHYAAENPVYTNENDTQHSTPCAICGTKSYGNHYAANGISWDGEKKSYTGTCVCEAEVVSDMLYKTEPYNSANGDSTNGFLTATTVTEDGMTFRRYTAGETVPGDAYFWPYRNGTAVTGKFMVIRYRVSNGGTDLAVGQVFASSTASGKQPGATGASANYTTSAWIDDGEWHTMIVHPKAENETFTPNADGTVTWGYLRINVNGIKPGNYVDIAEIAFADNIDAAEHYAFKNDANTLFRNNLDFVKIDDAETGDKGGGGDNKPKAVDLSGKTITNAATSLKLGGWCVTPGGIASYKLRVTSIDGEKVESPELVDWVDAGTISETDGVVAEGAKRGFGVNCRYGARYYENAVDLTDWVGHTINFEIVIVTNFGGEATILQINNVTVPVVPNYLVNANALSNQTEHTGLTYALSADGEYVTYTHKAGEEWSDCFAYAIYPPASVNVPTVTTGEYIMIKYRTTSTLDWGMFIGANNGDDHATGGKDSFTVAIKNGDKGAIIADGEWQYLIIDAKFLTAWNGVLPEDGTEDVYSIDYLRIDYFNEATDGGETVDVAYVAISDSIDELVVYAGMDSYTYVDSYSGGVINKTVVVNEAQ